MLKKWGNLGKDWDPASVESIVNFPQDQKRSKSSWSSSLETKKSKTLLKLSTTRTRSHLHDVRKTSNMDANYPDPDYDVDDFRNGSKVAIEFQIVSRNFKASKKIDAVKASSFRLLGVYLIEDPAHSSVSTPEKRRRGENEWIITPPRTKRTITSMKPLDA